MIDCNALSPSLKRLESHRLCMGAYFAIWQAMKAFRPDLPLKLSAPLTPEKVLLSLYTEPS
ncbi:MAG: hypothetical protein ABFS56_32460 [Pseudomonadota bacterium]